MASKNSTQLSTASTPALTAAQHAVPESLSSPQRRVMANQAVRASRPNAQRNHTAMSGLWPASSRKMPSVPSSTPPATISHKPLRSRAAWKSDATATGNEPEEFMRQWSAGTQGLTSG
ncbi:hypothetical protein D9M68_973050 [compost metagenome]